MIKLKMKKKKVQAMKPYQMVDSDTQFRVPQKVEEDKKISHKQVFGGSTTAPKPKPKKKKSRKSPYKKK